MSTKAVTGRAGALYWSTNLAAATSSQVKVAELQDCTFTVSRKSIDVTSHDSSGFQENLYGIQDTKVSGKINYFSTSPAVRTAVNQIIGSAPLNLRFTVAATTSKTAHFFVQTGLVTRFEHSLPTEKQIVGTVELVGTGVVTRTS